MCEEVIGVPRTTTVVGKLKHGKISPTMKQIAEIVGVLLWDCKVEGCPPSKLEVELRT
jgi:coenzyme F420-reducing hydrogenase gamma subunit